VSGIRQIVPVPDGGRRFRAYTAKHLDDLTARAGLGEAERLAVRAVGTVLPFRTNAYVIEELIDWSAAPDDPLYCLVFPQADILPAADVARIAGLLARGAPEAEITAAAHEVRMQLNPHPQRFVTRPGRRRHAAPVRAGGDLRAVARVHGALSPTPGSWGPPWPPRPAAGSGPPGP
jgi:hypothetical protein